LHLPLHLSRLGAAWQAAAIANKTGNPSALSVYR
jgi:hypothetical protein